MTDDDLTYVRTVSAERDLVFACLTHPASLSAFWGPDGTTTPRDGIVVEPHPGGRFETLMVNIADGSSYLMRCRFERVDPPESLSWIDVDSGMATSIVLRAAGSGRTELTIVQRRVPDAARTPRARAGFATSLDRFERFLVDLVQKDR